jgi:membrane-associated protease RseP (regulator of RpoE activity)
MSQPDPSPWSRQPADQDAGPGADLPPGGGRWPSGQGSGPDVERSSRPWSSQRVWGASAPPSAPTMTLREQRGALIRLALVVIGGLIASAFLGAFETVLVVLALIVMIVLHEFGHFVTAKAAGMKVTEFFVGFGPRLWAVQKGETTYGVKALPLGGYCRIIGMTNLEEVEPADEARAYRNRPVWRRLTVAFAGSFVHFVLAFVMLVVLFVGPGDQGNFVATPASNPIASLVQFTNGKSPAQLAGLQAGDRIEAVDGHHFATFDQLSAYLEARPDQRVTLTVLRHGRIITTSTVLADKAKVVLQGSAAPLATTDTGFLGISPDPTVHFGLVGAVSHAGTAFGHTMASAVSRLATRITDFGNYLHLVASKKAADSPTAVRFVSPVGVVRLAHQASQLGLSWVLYLLIVINIFLGAFNLVPLLPLDGGHVAIAIYEKIRSLRRGRPYHADVAKMTPVLYLVLAVLAFYAVTSLFLDLRDLVS